MVAVKTSRMSSGPMAGLPLGKDPADVRRRIEAMEKLLERAFVIPGTKQTIGLDVILDLVPGVGTTIAAAMAPINTVPLMGNHSPPFTKLPPASCCSFTAFIPFSQFSAQKLFLTNKKPSMIKPNKEMSLTVVKVV